MSSLPAIGNRLAGEKSPYLLQHAGNPVAWQPWDEAAWSRARAEQKPIFLSIGYSTCHWCHVMAHESFENPELASLLNSQYIPVKVDREERPDVDRLYMRFVQATTGRGGWPLSVWLTPELKPFYGGTYFPPDDRRGQPGFGSVLQALADAWRTRRAEILERGEAVIQALREHGKTLPPAGDGTFDRTPIDRCVEVLGAQFDEVAGGFGGAPKFPRPVALNLLWRVAAREPDSARGGSARTWAERTLAGMAAGGVRDHLGGGFHRYAVDAHWRVPHFEKMLYDQAQLALAYLEGGQASGRADFLHIACEIIEYVRRDLTEAGGGFFSAEDADSARPEAPGQHGEGAFYLWSRSEIEQVVGSDADLFCAHYGVEPAGNAPAGTDPQGEFQDANILFRAQTPAESAAGWGIDVAEVERRLSRAGALLKEVRDRRPRPARDDKILTGWNGLMIAACARAAQVLGTRDERLARRDSRSSPGKSFLEMAVRAADFLRREMYDEHSRRLFHVWRGGRGSILAFAEDYAGLIAGLLDLYEAGGDFAWLRWAESLQEEMDTLFWDGEAGGFFGSPAGDASVLIRMKESYDGAEPSANSLAALNLARLAAMTGRIDWRERAGSALRAFARAAERAPESMPQMLVALDFFLGPVRQIVLAGQPDDPRMQELARVVHGRLEAPRIILWADGGEGQAWLAQRLPELRDMHPCSGLPTAYVCREFVCDAPTNDPAQLERLLT